MFKFKGISSRDMQVIIEEEEHFIARAAKRYETIEIEGRNGAIFNELGYSYVERPIYVQCLNINKIDQILAWLNGEGEFEYKGRKTIARFYSQLDPQRDTCIRIIDTTFIRDPFWNKVNEEYQTVKDSKIKTITGNPIHITDSSNMPLSFKLNGGSRQESREGYNLLPYPYIDTTKTTAGITFTDNGDGTVTANGTATGNAFFNLSKPKLALGEYRISGIPEGASLSTYYIKFGTYYTSSGSFQWGADGGKPTESYICISEGVTVNNLIFKPMLVSGTEDKPYQQYGVMPSPDYPSKVETVGSNVNFYNEETAEKNKYLDGDTGTTGSSQTSKISDYIELTENEYTISYTNDTNSRGYSFYDAEKNFISGKDNNKAPYIIIKPENAKYIRFAAPINALDIKIEQGTKATPYSPYNQGSVEIKKINKNFINLQEKTTEWSGATITRNKNKITFTGGSNGTSAMNYTCEEINLKLKAGINLTYSSKYIKGNYTGGQTYYNIKLFYSDGTSEMLQMYRNYTDVKADKIVKKTLSKDLISYYIYGSTYEVKGLTTELVYEFQLEIGNEATEIVESESQTKILPIQQEMLEGDYIEDIEHHEWGKVILDGTENINLDSTYQGISQFTLNNITNGKFVDDGKTISALSNYFKGVIWSYSWTKDNSIVIRNDSKGRIMSSEFTTAEQFKTFLQEQYSAGTPVIVYYKLATPIDLELTEEQEETREGFNTYKGVTNISVDNELATLDVEYTAETTEKITNEGNIYSEPIIRLEKTQTEAVEVTINDIRFKYDFNNEEYVEIDCEKKTVEYEGLNRNRQIEIGYDFPKLKVGENEIIMHSGDCVIKVLRKDRWL